MKTTSVSFKTISSYALWMIFSMCAFSKVDLYAAPTLGDQAGGYSYYAVNPTIITYWEAPCAVDKSAPSVFPLMTTIYNCTSFPSLPWSAFIEVSDNCTPGHRLKIYYSDSTVQNCSGSEIITYRTWRVTDLAGNVAVVTQPLYTNRAQLNQIKFPDTYHAYCPAIHNTSETITGVPTYLGEPVHHYCGITVSYKDIPTKVCGKSVNIRRHWTVTDCCTLYALNHDQDIYYHDTTKPVIICPAPLIYSTNVKECYSHQIIPSIVASDLCDPLGLDIFVIVDGFTKLRPGQRAILSLGAHTFQYQVTDACGNIAICNVPVQVNDGTPPLLSCHPIEVCLLTDSVRIGVKQMVEEYWDDCSGLSKVTLKIRKLEDNCGDPLDDLVFKDSVTICCARDDGNLVLVEIEAKDQAGNTAYCITEVNVTSKLPVQIICQDSVKLTCGMPIPDIIPAINFCGDYTIETKVVFDNRNAGGIGTLIRRYIVTAESGLKDSCQTVFTVGLGTNAFGIDDIICPNGNVDVIGCMFPNINAIPGLFLKDTARPCAQITINLKLDTFTNLGTPCLRIRRTWTVKDALQPAINVICVQNINIIDTVRPKLTGVRDTTVIASLACNAIVDLPPMIAMDCDPNVIITNTLNAQGANIGPVVFPKGMTLIKYRAIDKCGNRDSITIKVTVTDTAKLRVICQNDTIIPCGANFTPRAATIIASCNQISSNVLRSDTIRSRCSITKINFKRIVTDTSGRKDSCTFMVTFRAADTLFCNQISWPKDTTLANCAKSIHPDSINLKPIFNFIQGVCARVVVSFKDTTIAVSNGPSCANTTRRIWTVQDTCPLVPLICRDTQLIMVVDITKPILKVPKDTCVFLKFPTLCDTLLNFLGSATAMDCDPNVNIKNVILGRTDTAGASLIRRYGLGETRVLVLARDACGNLTKDTVIIMVKDTVRPVAACKKSNNFLNDQGFVRVNARLFDGGSKDNCTPPSQLRFSWTQNVNDTILEVDCDSIKILRANGPFKFDTVRVFPFERNFNLWVTDASGNQDTCLGNRFLAFFDTLNLCGKNAIRNTSAIAGKVSTMNGKSIPNVIFSAIGDEQYQSNSNTEGAFALDRILPGMYKVFPYKNDDPTLGVSTIDLLNIQKHIMGVDRFTQMDQFIAADINKDGDITSVDLIELRKLVLGIYSQFPQNTSWRFFDQSLMARTTDHHTMAEFENPYVEAVDKGISKQNFTGIKIGDVNRSAVLGWATLESRSIKSLDILAADITLTAGNIIELPLYVDATGIEGLQGSLRFDHISILGVTSDQAMLLPGQYQETVMKSGQFNFSWIRTMGYKSEGQQLLTKLLIRANRSGKLADFMQINHKVMKAEAYESVNIIRDLKLRFNTIGVIPQVLDRMVLWQNNPNPFHDRTAVRYSLPQPGQVTWTISDLTGRVITTWSRYQPVGDHQIMLDKKDLGVGGIYYYKMDFNGYSDVRKLILLE